MSLKASLLALALCAGLAVSGCTGIQAVTDTALNAATTGSEQMNDKLAVASKRAQCIAPLGGASRMWTIRSLINGLEDCGVSLSELRDELLRRVPLPEISYGAPPPRVDPLPSITRIPLEDPA